MIYGVCGPTASGKTELAIFLAKRLHAPIVNADAFQVYKGMDIGTNKDKGLIESMKTHIFDIVTPEQGYTVAQYQIAARQLIEKAMHDQSHLVIVGGSGLYLKATLFDFQFSKHQHEVDMTPYLLMDETTLHKHLASIDEISALSIHPKNRRRVLRAIEVYLQTGLKKSEQEQLQDKSMQYPVHLVAIDTDRELLYHRINQRVEHMLSQGLLEEVQHLLTMYPKDSRGFEAIGYKEVIEYLDGFISYDGMVEKIQKVSRNYAKRQYTYFKNQLPVRWFSSLDHAKDTLSNEINSQL
jgi:tRNA dimethylallyltransferase